MRRTILLSLFVLLVAVGAAHHACAQRHGGARLGFSRGGYGFSRARVVSPYSFGYGYLPYDSGDGYSYPQQPVILVEQTPLLVQAPAPPVVERPVNPVVTEYKWPAASAASTSATSLTTSDSQSFAIVLKDGSTLSAVMVFASDDGLHYVDSDDRHLRISISEVDRAATLKLNRARNLNLYLPAAQ